MSYNFISNKCMQKHRFLDSPNGLICLVLAFNSRFMHQQVNQTCPTQIWMPLNIIEHQVGAISLLLISGNSNWILIITVSININCDLCWKIVLLPGSQPLTGSAWWYWNTAWSALSELTDSSLACYTNGGVIEVQVMDNTLEYLLATGHYKFFTFCYWLRVKHISNVFTDYHSYFY